MVKPVATDEEGPKSRRVARHSEIFLIASEEDSRSGKDLSSGRVLFPWLCHGCDRLGITSVSYDDIHSESVLAG